MVFYLQLFFLMLCIGLVDVQNSNCCISKRFNGQVRILRSAWDKGETAPNISDNRFKLDYDYDLKMDREEGVLYTYTNGIKNMSWYTIINDYNTMKSYYLQSHAGHCSSMTITTAHRFLHCLPSYLHLQNFEEIGSDHNPVHVHIWEGTDGNITQRMTTSSYDCTPISSTVYGKTSEGTTFSATYLYSNYTQYQLSGPDVFKIPTQCLNPVQPVGK